MPTYRFPALVCRDAACLWTAVLADSDDPLAGFASTRSAAIDQLREYLHWVGKVAELAIPDFLEPQLLTIRVDVRPEYRDGKKVFSSEQKLALRVPCVHGKQESGMLVASLPLLGIRFFYHAAETLKELVQRYVTQKFEGMSPGDLAQYLSPEEVALDEVVVRLKARERSANVQMWPPTLQKVAEALGDRAIRKQYPRAWERDTLVEQVVGKLREERVNVLLVGDPGVGKSTVLAEAVRIVEASAAAEAQRSSSSASSRIFWLTSAGRLIAGMRYLGQWEERVETVIEELQQIGGVLCAERLLEFVRLGGFDASDSIAAFVGPFLQRGELRMAAEATPAELEACRRLLPGFADLFQVVHVPPFDRPQALAVLDRVAGILAQNARVELLPGTVDRVYQLFRRFMPYQVFPGRAVAFLRHLFEKDARPGGSIGSDEALGLFVRQTGLPEKFLKDEQTLSTEEVQSVFRADVIDQEEATGVATDLVMTFKAGLNDPHRPIGVLLSCGPTGVGKTALAKSIARYFFGSGGETDRLLRLDMSEYAGFDAAERLLGPPFGEPSSFIRQMRQQPFRVVLFDEIEKANSDIFDLLLGVFDEGRLTDRFGRVTTFRSSIVLMTSNLGAERQRSLGFAGDSAPRYTDEARAYFRPEFFNRLDGVVTFCPLSESTIREITRKELADLGQREGLQRIDLKLDPSTELVEFLAKIGFDIRYGARPLQRTIERVVIGPLARWLLEHPTVRNTTLRLGLSAAGEITIT